MDYLNIDYNSTYGWSIVLIVILLGVIALSSYQQGSIKEFFQARARGQVQARHSSGERNDGRRRDGNDGRRDGNDGRRYDGNRHDGRRHDDGNRHQASWRWNNGDWRRDYRPQPSSWGWGSWWPSWGVRDPCADIAVTQCQYSSNYPACYNNSYANCVNRGIV
jgi:hypothetical protein